MLAADKLQLQSALKQQATALKEKEFNLHHSNFMTVGTQAAVLAGLDITMFIEFNPPDEQQWAEEHRVVARTLKCVYYAVIVGAFCANMIVVSQTTALSVWGAGLALRGPDGSMVTATEGLYEERRPVFVAFGIGLALTLGSVLLSVWLLLHWEAALVCWLVTIWTSRTIYMNYRRVQKRFVFDESETVDFNDIFYGPAAIRAVPYSLGLSGTYDKAAKGNRTTKRSNSTPLEVDTHQASTSNRHSRSGHASRTNSSNVDENLEDGNEAYYDDQDDLEDPEKASLVSKSYCSSRRRRAGKASVG